MFHYSFSDVCFYYSVYFEMRETKAMQLGQGTCIRVGD